MRDTLGAILVLGTDGGGATGSVAGRDGVAGMSDETLCDFRDFRGVQERVGFRMDLKVFISEVGDDVMSGGVTGRQCYRWSVSRVFRESRGSIGVIEVAVGET